MPEKDDIERGALGLVNHLRDRVDLPPLAGLHELNPADRDDYVWQAEAVLDAANQEVES